MSEETQVPDFLRRLAALPGMLENYEERQVGRDFDPAGGIGVSTCFTTDEGFETAILDAVGAHPVERYKTREEAEAGHKRWLGLLPDLEEITALYWSSEPQLNYQHEIRRFEIKEEPGA